MITEDYVSFDTAKLLKAKVFDDEYTNAFYDKNGSLYFIHMLSDFSEHPDNDTDIAASTLYVAMKWLREVHYYNIEIDTLGMMELNTLSWRSAVYYLVNENECYCEDGFDSYEEACEAAIRYCLKNLI